MARTWVWHMVVRIYTSTPLETHAHTPIEWLYTVVDSTQHISLERRKIVWFCETLSHRVSCRLLLFCFMSMLGALCSPSKRFVSPISDTLVGFSCVPTYSAFSNFNLRSPSPFFHLPLCIVRDCTYTRFCLFPMLTPVSFSGWIMPVSPPTIQCQKKKMLVSIILGSAIVVNNINVSGGAGDCILLEVSFGVPFHYTSWYSGRELQN
jgi:hypothetical protein